MHSQARPITRTDDTSKYPLNRTDDKSKRLLIGTDGTGKRLLIGTDDTGKRLLIRTIGVILKFSALNGINAKRLRCIKSEISDRAAR